MQCYLGVYHLCGVVKRAKRKISTGLSVDESYRTGIRHEEFKSLLNFAGTEGALQISQEQDKEKKIVSSGFTEHLYAFTHSGLSTITVSNNSGLKSWQKPCNDDACKNKKQFQLSSRQEEICCKASLLRGLVKKKPCCSGGNNIVNT